MKRASGFTMIELLISSAIMVILASLLFASLLIGRSSYLSADTYVHVQEEARRALDVMTRELRASRDTLATGANRIDFQVALGYDLAVAGCPADDVCWGARDQNGVDQPAWTIRYDLANGQLVRELWNEGALQAGRKVLANDVRSATFTYNPAMRTVAIGLEVLRASPQLPGGAMGTSQVKLPDGSIGASPLISTVRLRN